ncbi:xylulokinase [Demequina aurantiaca]|uniref:xylulokinase n=1 Tax=Demequina aurantiaca TaxID=676200 RepID=UPI0007837502|nr:xylulokinase [Demequina aurantiaca]
MTLVAGVDSSTQSCKVVVRDLESGAVVRSGRASHPDSSEVPPAAWWDALREAIADAGGLSDVDAVSVGGQQHGMVALDKDGRVIRDALLWNDTRSADAAVDLISEVGAEQLAERTGLVPVASFTITKLRWLRDNEPANAERVAAVALPHDWLTWRLRGYGPADESPLGPDLNALTTDRSDASGTGYWSPATGDYDRGLLIQALGHDVILPRVLAPGDVVDTQASGIDLDSIVIGVGAGDNAAAGLGLGAREGDVVISIGTSGTVFAVTDSVVRDTSGTVAGFADASGAYLPLIATLNAARVLDAFTRVLGVNHDELGSMALEAGPGAQGAVLVPYFEGERTPNLPDATAGLSGLTLASTTRPNLARAAIEGMLCGLADGLEAIQSLGVKADRALLIGGAAQNSAVSTIAAQVLGIPVSVPTPGEYVAMGAAVQAGWSLTGTRPSWSVDAVEVTGIESEPVIREQYRAAQTKA